jgi:hypothetical protein
MEYHREGTTMIDTATINGSLRELAYRESNGVEITLLWLERDDQLAVTVRDTKSDEFFALRAARLGARRLLPPLFLHGFPHARHANWLRA